MSRFKWARLVLVLAAVLVPYLASASCVVVGIPDGFWSGGDSFDVDFWYEGYDDWGYDDYWGGGFDYWGW
jgi:hypothetical protein